MNLSPHLVLSAGRARRLALWPEEVPLFGDQVGHTQSRDAAKSPSFLLHVSPLSMCWMGPGVIFLYLSLLYHPQLMLLLCAPLVSHICTLSLIFCQPVSSSLLSVELVAGESWGRFRSFSSLLGGEWMGRTASAACEKAKGIGTLIWELTSLSWECVLQRSLQSPCAAT